ncbi:MAG TPA: DUF5711 family protein [Tissierellales bacterium]|nr:DUF5711 family protein [Tissierellales bacterium]
MEKREVKKDKKGFKIFLIIFGIAIVVVFKTGYKGEFVSKVGSLFKIKKTFETVETIPMNFENEEANVYGNIIIKKDGGKLLAYDLNGSKKWEKNINVDEGLVFLGNKFIYLCSKGTGQIELLNNNGEIAQTIESNPQIANITEKNEDLVLLFKDEGQENIVIMNNNNEILGKNSVKGARIFSIAINNSKTKYVVSTLSHKDDEISNYLHIYKMDGKEIENIDFGKNLILYTEFITDDIIVVFTDEEVYCIKDGKTLWTKEMEKGKDIYIDEENKEIYLLNDKNIKVISDTGEVEREISLSQDYKRILPFDKGFLLYGDEHVAVLEEDKEIIKYKNEEKIEEIIVKEPYIILFDFDKINIMNIKTKL